MFRICLFALIGYVLLSGCNGSVLETKDAESGNEECAKADTSEIPHLPIFGYRFTITGDFNGDSKTDTLEEHFFSKRDQKEVCKYFSGASDYFVQCDSSYRRECISYMQSRDGVIDTLMDLGVTGPIWIHNEGDLDGDGADDLSLVQTSPQMSSVTHCYILGYKKGKWQEIYRFEVREWQFPALPSAGKTYGMFGTDGMYDTEANDSINAVLEEEMKQFPGLIHKRKNGKVEIETFAEGAMDTLLVLDLSKHPKPYN